MNRFSRSFTLAKASWGVLRSEPSLFAFPVIGFLVNVVVVAVFFALFVFLGVLTTGAESGTATGTQTTAMSLLGWVLVIALYIVMAYVTTLFLAALVIGARETLHGRDTTFGSAFSAALAKSPFLLAWALFQGTVSWILNSISRNGGLLGGLVSGLLGAAWEIFTFLAVPIIVNEDAGPIRALKRSGTLIKTTWGENVIGQAGFGIVGFVAGLPAFALLVGGIAALGANVVLGGVLIGAAVLYLALVASFIAALSGVYRAALYEYATTGTVPSRFEGFDLQHAFAGRGAR